MCQFLKNTKTRIDTEKNTRHDTGKTRTRHGDTNCQLYSSSGSSGDCIPLLFIATQNHTCPIESLTTIPNFASPVDSQNLASVLIFKMPSRGGCH